MKKLIQSFFALFNIKFSRIIERTDPILDTDQQFNEIYEKCKPYTMVSKAACYSLYSSVKYIVKSDIKGAFVECGVWRGGASLLIAETLCALGVKDRDLYLYDTYAGMSEPTAEDVHRRNKSEAIGSWQQNKAESHNEWCYADLALVKSVLASSDYLQEHIHFIKGKVEDTIPATMPEGIALLRLDTDWYNSTRHELLHLYPLLKQHGILIIDDYGSWDGARKAVDEYFADSAILLNRIDTSVQLIVKV